MDLRKVGEMVKGDYRIALWEVVEGEARGYFVVGRREEKIGVSGDLGGEVAAWRFFRLAAALELDPLHLGEAGRDFRLGEEFGPGQVLLGEGAEVGRTEGGYVQTGDIGDAA